MLVAPQLVWDGSHPACILEKNTPKQNTATPTIMRALRVWAGVLPERSKRSLADRPERGSENRSDLRNSMRNTADMNGNSAEVPFATEGVRSPTRDWRQNTSGSAAMNRQAAAMGLLPYRFSTQAAAMVALMAENRPSVAFAAKGASPSVPPSA